ncbi:gastric inhibitory polypeptide receptor isoform X6 [Symphalangus syndactylus]|uniref:gastric inhibitory polypeptide receptor isoform X6 n=1 Tax=Symphalangus syndactylus TaxID=9590 RepID=UPI003006A5F1
MTTSPILQLLLRLSLWGLLLRRAEALRGRRRGSCTSAGNGTAGSARRPWQPWNCLQWLQVSSSASVAVMASGDFGETIHNVRTQRRMRPFWRLHCTRNYIHINLFTSFMLRAAAILSRDRLLPRPGPYLGDQAPVLWNQALAACRTAQIVTQYCVGANYTWLLVEGVYLHSLLVLVGGSEEGHFRYYLLLGWGAPALFVIPWMIVRYLYENTQCWERNEVKAIWWIIRTPILMTILVGSVPPPPGRPQGFPILGSGVPPPPAPPEWDRGWLSPYLSPQINFLIFIRILGILLSKLRTRQMRCRDYRLRLARSTLTLVPLLGVHEVVFAPVTEEQARGALRFAKLGFEIFLSSFQGFLVSVLYCFINKEVQSEIRRGWHHCRLRRSLGEEQRQLPERAFRALPSGSGPGEVSTGRGLSSGTLPGPGKEASRELESYC